MKPLHLLCSGNLPSKLKKKFDDAWQPILEAMHSEVAALISNTSMEKIDELFIHSAYEHSFKNVCIKYPDISMQLYG